MRFWQLLLVTAIGAMFSGLRLLEISGFAITIAHATLVLLALSLVWRFRYIDARVFAVWLAIVLLEIGQGLFAGGVSDPEWYKSVAQFLAYSTTFLLIITFRLEPSDAPMIASLFIKAALVVSALSILQFILLALGVSVQLPSEWAVRNIDAYQMSYRYGGFAPAFGLASEPAHHASGLVVLLASLIFWGNAYANIAKRRIWWLSLGLLLIAIILSFSLSGILTAFALISVSLLYSRRIQKRISVYLVVVGVLLLISGGIFEPVRNRLMSVSQGSDDSAMIRIVASTRLLFATPDSIKELVFGTGMGRENSQLEMFQRIYRETILTDMPWETIKIHNLYTIVRVTQGWVGVALYTALLWFVTRPLTPRVLAYASLLVFLLLYQFSTGKLLSPHYWAILGLIYLLRRFPRPSPHP